MPSILQSGEQGGLPPPTSGRYDEEMQQRIIALASQLQHQYQGTASAAEIEAATSEVGLEATFVRQAMALLASQGAASVTVKPLQAPEQSRGLGWSNVLCSPQGLRWHLRLYVVSNVILGLNIYYSEMNPGFWWIPVLWLGGLLWHTFAVLAVRAHTRRGQGDSDDRFAAGSA